MVNWTSYNESLVRRGEVILDFDIIDGLYVEFERMNEGKRGATYDYPNSGTTTRGYQIPKSCTAYAAPQQLITFIP